MTVLLGATRLQAHPLALMFWAVAALLGDPGEVAALLVSLAVHEGAHLLAARRLGVRVTQLRLMPFGGAIAMENPYSLPAAHLAAVAAAGPAGNLLLLVAGAALAHWRMISPALSLSLLRSNLVLSAFNLLPALPLDGGRLLYALLAPRLGRARAAELGIWLGRAVALALLGLAAASCAALGRLNLSPLFAAVFLLSSAPAEREALAGVRLKTVLSELRPLDRPTPARVVAVSGDCSARQALRAARPDALTLYAVYEGSRLASFTDDRRLLQALLDGGKAEVTIGNVLGS